MAEIGFESLLAIPRNIPIVGKFFDSFANLLAPGTTRFSERSAMYRGDRSMPNVAPDPQAIIKAYFRGFFGPTSEQSSYTTLATGLRNHGIALQKISSNGGVDLTSGWSQFWEKMLQLNYPWPDVDALIHWYIIGLRQQADRDSEAFFNRMMQNAGHGSHLQVDWIKARRTAYTPQQIMYAFGTMDRQALGPYPNAAYAEWKKTGLIPLKHDATTDDVIRMQERFNSRVSVNDVIKSMWRGASEIGDVIDALKRNGVMFTKDQNAALTNLYPIPEYGRLMQIVAQGGAKNPYVERMGLDQELAPELIEWGKANGLGWHEINLPVKANQQNISWAEFEWRGHWTPYSLHQLMRGLHQLGPRTINKWRHRINGNVEEFTPDSVKEDMSRLNIPPGMRDTLIAQSYTPLGLRAIMRILRLPPWHLDDVDQLLHAYGGPNDNVGQKVHNFVFDQAIESGNHPNDARILADISRLQFADNQNKPWQKIHDEQQVREAAQGKELYAAGLIDDGTLTRNLQLLGYDVEQSQEEAHIIQRKIDLEDFKLMVARIRADYFSGEYTGDYAEQLLETAGMQHNRAMQTVNRWAVVFHRKRRILETGKIQDYVRRGLMSADAATIRLANMGWTGADILLMGLDTTQKIMQDQARVAAQSARAIAAGIKQQQAAIKEAQRQLARMQPPTKLIKLYDSGQITLSYLRQQLTIQGWSNLGIQTLLASSKPDKKLSKSDYNAMLDASVIDDAEWQQHLEDLGYDATAITEERQLLAAKSAKSAAKATAKPSKQKATATTSAVP